MRMTFESRLKYILAPLLAVPVLLLGTYSSVQAAELTNRYLLLDNSQVSVTATHTFGFDIVSPDDIGSIVFDYCSNSPLDDDPCLAPTGLDVSVASLDTQLGETGFSIHGSTTATRLVLSRVVATPTLGPVQYIFGDVINPDTVGSQYVRIYTYLSDDGSGTHIDRGGLAYSISELVNVSAYVPPVLRFCVAVAIPGSDCTSASGSRVNFGILSPTTTGTGTTQMMAATNGVGGYNISVQGTTMTSGNNVISSLPARTSSLAGTQQFGMNLVDNSSPNIGASVSGVGTGIAASEYNFANQFKFVSGDLVASSPLSTDYNKYTSSYIVNINDNQPPGVYATTLTFIAFASF